MDSNPTKASNTVPVKRSFLQALKRAVGLAAIAIALFGAVYLGGYLHGRTEVARLKEQHAADRAAEAATRAELTQSLESAKQKLQALTARRDLDQAISALDARNFGIAEQKIKAAAAGLRGAGLGGSGTALLTALEGFHLVATEDLGPQRRQLFDWLTQLDTATGTTAH